MLKHANFDKTDHLKGHINCSFQCDNRVGPSINVTTWDKRFIKTKKNPCVDEQNITEIMDTCPNYAHTLLHGPQPHQET
jgi:hypothetical protein